MFVQQRTPNDCAIAAIAMATRRSYEEVMAAAADLYVAGQGVGNTTKVLRNLGLLQDNLAGQKEPGDFHSYYVPWGIDGVLLRAWTWGRPALYSVPSLNIEDGSHMIYYDGLLVHDPNPPERKRYSEESFEDLRPTEAIVFRVRA